MIKEPKRYLRGFDVITPRGHQKKNTSALAGLRPLRLKNLAQKSRFKKNIKQSSKKQKSIRKILFFGIKNAPIPIVAVLMAFNVTIGQWLILGYAVYSLIFKRESHEVFVVAAIVLISIPIFQALGFVNFSSNAAIYVLELLVVGTVLSVRHSFGNYTEHDPNE
jgi:hypothetical protein